MTLTTTDLSQIKKIFQDSLKDYPQRKELDKKFEAVDKKFDVIDKRLENFDKKFEAIDKRLENFDKKFEEINQKLDLTINFFDRDYLLLKGRVERIEKLLKITPLSI